MDIIDIMLARAMTPQGKTEIYVNKANKAAEKAEQAKADAEEAIATVTAAAEDITAAQTAAEELLASAQEALETAQEAQINTLDTEDVDDEIKKMDVSVNLATGQNANTYQVITTYPDDTTNTENATKMYKSTGSNEDGTMTQKAITDSLNTKADITYVNNQISNISTSSSSSSEIHIHFDESNAGHIIIVDENGNLISSVITEEMLLNNLTGSDLIIAQDAIGLDMHYSKKTFTRIHNSTTLAMGSDFDTFKMYGGRVKCNVADDGTINAFYGQPGYIEDGSNGQVMIYQPKFYYRRIPYTTENGQFGKIIRHESLLLSDKEQANFKLAPIFTGDLDYVLLPAYDGSLLNNKLASIAGAEPVSNISLTAAEAYAHARGNGWHIMNMAAVSANQMLEMVEFGTMNGQTALEEGIVYYVVTNNETVYFITGSTAALGNGTGHATETQVKINGQLASYDTPGYRAITYRGMENPWGNLWNMINGVNIQGDGKSNGGIPYISTNVNYSNVNEEYESIGFALPASNGWINAMGIQDTKYDWIFLPIECSPSANSLLPIGDSIWTTSNLNGTNVLAIGGSYGYRESCGPFYYAADRDIDASARTNYGAKLLYIPTKNAIYTANINKWNTYMGG